MDTRHAKRIKIVQEMFAHLFNSSDPAFSKKTQSIFLHLPEIDEKIKKGAPKYELSKIAKVDLSILRLAVYELTVEKKEPPKVIINEAIELAKDMAGEKSPAFINAALGKIYQEMIS